MIGRQNELSQLEDALLSANRGTDASFSLAGEAGIGKTRLAQELTRRTQKLGCSVSAEAAEVELSLPHLPFVEAIGKHLAEQALALVRAELGASVEFAQLLTRATAQTAGRR